MSFGNLGDEFGDELRTKSFALVGNCASASQKLLSRFARCDGCRPCGRNGEVMRTELVFVTDIFDFVRRLVACVSRFRFCPQLFGGVCLLN